ncbi:MAG: Gfo/Idh/MocA family oxidoreductase [Alphaproteobacteria bacterium]|nr:Gfo/Idh/MocA family oxidoreductase [Alphaproteobacteria bacterium]
MTDPLNVGILGAGYFGARHASAMARTGGCRLVAACRSEPDSLARFVGTHGGTPYRRIEELLADPAVEAVVIATPHHLHEAHAVAAARARKHILLEKPMASSLAACLRIAAAAREAGIVLMLGHTLRFAAPMAAAKAAIERGEIGPVRFARGALVKLWMEANRRDWHLDPARGGGMLFTAGIHWLDAVMWLVGEPVEAVQAALGARFHEQRVDDLAQITLRFRGGAIGAVTSLGYRDGAVGTAIEVVGDRGVLAIEPARGLRLGTGGQWRDLPVTLPAAVMEEALAEEWRAFIRAVRGGEAPAVDAAAGGRVVACIEACFESARLGREIAVAP